MDDNVAEVSFKVLRELSTLKHFSEQTVRDCIASVVKHKTKLSLTEQERQETFENVVKALRVLGQFNGEVRKDVRAVP